jgi:hypothetical protein
MPNPKSTALTSTAHQPRSTVPCCRQPIARCILPSRRPTTPPPTAQRGPTQFSSLAACMKSRANEAVEKSKPAHRHDGGPPRQRAESKRLKCRNMSGTVTCQPGHGLVTIMANEDPTDCSTSFRLCRLRRDIATCQYLADRYLQGEKKIPTETKSTSRDRRARFYSDDHDDRSTFRGFGQHHQSRARQVDIAPSLPPHQRLCHPSISPPCVCPLDHFTAPFRRYANSRSVPIRNQSMKPTAENANVFLLLSWQATSTHPYPGRNPDYRRHPPPQHVTKRQSK